MKSALLFSPEVDDEVEPVETRERNLTKLDQVAQSIGGRDRLPRVRVWEDLRKVVDTDFHGSSSHSEDR